jgi:uncharacterized protein (DUF4415 family)
MKRPKSKRSSRTEWSRLQRMSAASIRQGIAADPDARATDAEFWKTAKVVLPTPKEIVTMRLDADLLRWFRRERGYQTRINAICGRICKRMSRYEIPTSRKGREKWGTRRWSGQTEPHSSQRQAWVGHPSQE